MAKGISVDPAEPQIEQAILSSPKDGLDLDSAHSLLLWVSQQLGVMPERLTDRGFLFIKDNRAVTISLSYRSERYWPNMLSCNWDELDREQYRSSEYSPDVEGLPYWWRLDFANAQTKWFPPNPVARNWQEFRMLFSVYETLAADLTAIPPQWRPQPQSMAGNYLDSMWNLESDELVSVGISANPGKLALDIFDHNQTEQRIELTQNDIDRRKVDPAMLLAGVVKDADFANLQFFANEGNLFTFPEGRTRNNSQFLDDSELDESACEAPKKRVSFAEFRERLAGPLPEPKPRPERREKTAEQREQFRMRPVLNGHDWVERVVTPIASGADRDEVYEAAGIAKQLKRRSYAERLRLNSGQMCLMDDEEQWRQAGEITQSIVARYGMPTIVSASPGIVRRTWRLNDELAVRLEAGSTRPELWFGDYNRLLSLMY